MNAAIDTALLPPILQDIVDLIGLRATMTLVECYGGVRLYVPKLELEDDHPLICQIGREAAGKLQAMYGGEPHFDIPKAERALRAVRDARIRQLRGSGTPVRQLALEHRLTERQIRTICGEDGGDASQAQLF